MGGEDAEYLRAQAGLRDKAEKRDGTTQSLLDRFGTAPENESKALAEIDAQHGGDPTLKRFYLGRLQMQRRQERRDVAQSARNVYALALEGRQSEIEAADLQRLHAGGDLDGVLEAAQYARSAQAPGDLLFRERYLAMGEEERARFKPAELAKKLAPQDFLEVMQGASGGIDEGQRSRMQSFVQAVTPMLRSVTVGQYATPPEQENERDRRFLGLVHDEVKTLVADEEKKIGRPLTSTEYQAVMRRAADLALLHGELMEREQTETNVADTQGRSFGIGPALGLPVKPGGRGSPPPYGGIDLSLYPRQMQEEADARRMKSDHEYSDKFKEAIRDDELGFYIGPDKTKNTYNDLRFGRLGYGAMAMNEVEKWWHTRESSGAIDRLKEIDGNRARVQAVAEKMARGEKLNQQEDYIRQGMHLWPQHLVRKTKEALGDLATAEARRAQIPQSPALRKLNEAETVGDALKVLINNPLEIMAVKAGQAIPKTIANAAATLLTGPYGGILASAYVVFGSEYAGAVLKEFEDEGIDLQNESAVLEAIQKKDLMEKIYGKAFVVAGIASMAEVASGAVGNIKLTSVPSKTWGGIVEKAAQTGVKTGIGIAGKTGTGIVTGEKPTAGGRVESGIDGAMDLLIPDVPRLAF